MMKRFLTVLLCVFGFTLVYGEVIFIPGWLTEKMPTGEYESLLQEIYPGEKVTVLRWHSWQGWSDVIDQADGFAGELAKLLAGKTEKERSEIILIGHSLGGRIAVKTGTALAKQKLKIKQIILLGAAYDYDADYAPMLDAVSGNCINVFSRNDSILKYCYGNYQKKLAVGFCGLDASRYPNFLQYNMQTSEIPIANTDGWTALREAFNHFAINYLNELKAIQEGKVKPYVCPYDYSQVKIFNTFAKIPENLMIPPLGKWTVIDSYADWSFVRISVPIKGDTYTGYVVIDPYGKIKMWNVSKTILGFFYEVGIKNKIKRIDGGH